MTERALILFSGGKDSYFALLEAQKRLPLALVVSVASPQGDTQLHAGPEADKALREAQLALLGLPCDQIGISSEKSYLHELFFGLDAIVKKHGITHVVTGDLWHPYTSGIGDMLAGALGVMLARPARERCPSRDAAVTYMHEILDAGIQSIIISVREQDLPREFVGRTIDRNLIAQLAAMNIDGAAEGGEYQSFVVAGPLMNGRIVIDDFDVQLSGGKNGKEKFHRMVVKSFHIEKL